MHLHAKVPLLSLLPLVHLRITCLFPILGRTWRMNECGVYHRAFGNQQPLSLKVSIDRFQQYRRQFVLLQKMMKIQYRGFFRQDIGKPAESCKATSADGLASQSWGNTVQFAAATLARVLPFPFRLRKPPGASGVSCDCTQDRQSSIGVTWRIYRAVVRKCYYPKHFRICSAFP